MRWPVVPVSLRNPWKEGAPFLQMTVATMARLPGRSLLCTRGPQSKDRRFPYESSFEKPLVILAIVILETALHLFHVVAACAEAFHVRGGHLCCGSRPFV